MLYSLIPTDALFILRPLFTTFISIIFILFFKIIKWEFKKNKKIITNTMLFLLSILLFILLSKFAKIPLLSSILIGSIFYLIIYVTIYKLPTFFKIPLLLILLFVNNEYLNLDNDFRTSNNDNINFFTFGFKENTTYYNSKEKYNGKTGLSKIYDDLYWGFNKKFPIRGRVFYPSNKGKFPLVFILHGNHLAENDSHKGYDYLLEYLAMNNYIAVSLDQNFLNGDWTTLGVGQPSENDVRAYHLLESINYIKSLNSNTNSKLYNKIDGNKIHLIGHSRGGEAVSIAASITNNINSVVALAPTDKQYKQKIKLDNSSFLLIQGANDGDLRRNRGINQYNRTSIKIGYKKANLFISGFNHSQFNSDWGKYDGTGIGNIFYTSKYIVSNKKQRDITKELILSFFNSEGNFNSAIIDNNNLNSLDYFYNYSDSSYKYFTNFNDLEYFNNIVSKSVKVALAFKNENYFIKSDWNKNGSLEFQLNKDTYIENLFIPINNPDYNSKKLKITLLPTNNEIIINVKENIQWRYLRFNILQKNNEKDIIFNQYSVPVNNTINGIIINSLDDSKTLYLDDIRFTSHQKKE